MRQELSCNFWIYYPTSYSSI